ncbi:Methyltransferase type 12 [Paramagnetospirillum magnetotacticum MS-1]|uniref:Methyltransferase type 12 n=2 Tax=Paramagnetospirillum magnetotacticum TaxID=188 RepID=A0A0C2YUB7_PARME|nr:Methyltransferase type 12 [Paramagnetospirillum magnetotacticum MS-1]
MLPVQCRIQAGTTSDLIAADQGERYDSVIYIDVLEHIEDDSGELARAFALLRPSGTLVVLSPAFQWLYTAFDHAIGHVRRYDRDRLTAIAPAGAASVRMSYLDSVGMAASMANRLLLRSGMPTLGQVLTWDRWMVPASRYFDPLIGGRFGKSILAVWRR